MPDTRSSHKTGLQIRRILAGTFVNLRHNFPSLFMLSFGLYGAWVFLMGLSPSLTDWTDILTLPFYFLAQAAMIYVSISFFNNEDIQPRDAINITRTKLVSLIGFGTL